MTDKLSPTVLLPCPFCGGEPAMPYFGNRVECVDCEGSVCGEEAWNRRSLSASGDVAEQVASAVQVALRNGTSPTEAARAALTASGNSGAVSDDLKLALKHLLRRFKGFQPEWSHEDGVAATKAKSLLNEGERS